MTDPRQTYRWKKLRPRILERDGYRCAYCGRPATEVDHYRPLVRGGEPFDPDNLKASCLACNRARGNRMRRKPRVRRLFGGFLGVQTLYPPPNGFSLSPRHATIVGDYSRKAEANSGKFMASAGARRKASGG